MDCLIPLSWPNPSAFPAFLTINLLWYFVTSVTKDRVKAFDLNDFGPFAACALIEIAAKFKFEVSAYVVMPDHVHFLVTAIEEGADFKQMVKDWKQKTGFEWSDRHGRRLWQKGYWERGTLASRSTRFLSAATSSRTPFGPGWSPPQPVPLVWLDAVHD